MKNIRKISLMLVFTLVLSFMSIIPTYAYSGVIEGGHESQDDAYNWGYYSPYKGALTFVIPKNQTEFWVSFDLPSEKHIFARCSYQNEYAGMTLLADGIGIENGFRQSPFDVIELNSVLSFMAVNFDNNSSSTRTYYIRVTRPESYTGDKMVISLSLNERIKSGRATFDFRGTARNRGNSYGNFSNLGVESSTISLNLTNNNKIPEGAIITSVSTKGSMSPSQGSVHHMLRPASHRWFTSRVSSADSGMYHIDRSDNIPVKQEWEFKYNAMAIRSSSMSRVKLEVSWDYDIAETGYRPVFN